MQAKTMWMVRAGENAFAIEEFRALGVVAIGWTEDSVDWTKFSDVQSIEAQIARQHPDNSARQNQAAARQIERFLRKIEVGDRVISYDPGARCYLVGTIAGIPTRDPSLIEALQTCRKVEWESKAVPRDDLSVTTRNSLGAISTLFRVPEVAAAEIESNLANAPAPHPQTEEQVEDETDLLKDVRGRSHEFIKDRISRLDWDQLQQLVAGLLRAMGYKARVSPAGADRGKDIVASPDGFGFESPRIVVEVKHRKGAMGSNELRSFLGGRHKDDKGLYVSTGGFTKDALYEAERSNIPLTLMDMDDLAQAVAEYYERMDAEARALLPLIRIYWPA